MTAQPWLDAPLANDKPWESAPLAKPKVKAEKIAEPIDYAKQAFQDSSLLEQGLISAGNQFTGLGRRAKQLWYDKNSPEGIANQKLIDDESQMSSATYSTPMGWVGAALPYVAAAPLGVEAAIARGVGGGLVGAGTVGGAYGAAMPVETGGSTAENVLWGIGGGLLGHGIQKGASKLYNASKGYVDPAKKALMAKADKLGVPLSVGDLLGGTSRWIENRLEGLPLNGRRDFMAKQGAAIETAAKNVGKAFNAGLTEEPETVMAQGLRNQYNANRNQSSQLFKQVDDVAKASNAGTIKLDKTRQAVAKAVSEYPELFGTIGNSRTRQVMESLNSNVGDLPRMGFKELQQLRKLVGSELAAAKKRQLNGTPGASDAVNHYGSVFKAIIDDQNAWGAQKGGKVMKSLEQANKHFQDKILPYRNDPLISRYLDPNANPEPLLGMLNRDKFHSTPKLVSMMDEKGKEAARQAWVNRALSRSTSPEKENMSLFQLIKGIDPGRSGSRVFKPSQISLLGDLTDVAQTASRAAKVPPDPPTGQRNQWMQAAMLPLLGAGAGGIAGGVGDGSVAGGAAGGGVAGLIALGATLATAKGINSATKSRILQQYLIANPEVRYSKEWIRLVGNSAPQTAGALSSGSNRRQVQASEMQY